MTYTFNFDHVTYGRLTVTYEARIGNDVMPFDFNDITIKAIVNRYGNVDFTDPDDKKRARLMALNDFQGKIRNE